MSLFLIKILEASAIFNMGISITEREGQLLWKEIQTADISCSSEPVCTAFLHKVLVFVNDKRKLDFIPTLRLLFIRCQGWKEGNCSLEVPLTISLTFRVNLLFFCPETVSFYYTLYYIDHVIGVTTAFKYEVSHLNYSFLWEQIRTHPWNCDDWQHDNHSNVMASCPFVIHYF